MSYIDKREDTRNKTCSIILNFASEMKKPVLVPVVERGDFHPDLFCFAEENDTTEVRFNFVNAFTLLAESVASAILLLEAGALAPSMVILHDAGSNPTQRKGKMCRGALFS